MTNFLQNADFESGLTGWEFFGSVCLDHVNIYKGTTSLKLGASAGGVRQRLSLRGNQLIQFEVYAQSPTSATCILKVTYYNEDNEVLKTSTASTIANEYSKSEIYALSPALTSYALASIEKTDGVADYVFVDNTSFKYVNSSVIHEPEIDLDLYELPLWKGNTIYNETVLLYSKGDEVPTGKLLYFPTRILSIQSYSLKTSYEEENDYTISGNTITLTAGSRIPYMRDVDFPDTAFHYYELSDTHIVVTYTHNGTWDGPAIDYRGDRLPNTVQKLKDRESIQIVAYGDSITRGLNVSSYDQIPPYMPTWAELFADILRKKYGYSDIRMDNASLPGAGSEWGAVEADMYVTPLNPDLVIVAFGMNDFWSVEGTRFKANIQTIIDKVKAKNPTVEFLLVSSMMFDSAYVNDGKLEDYSRNMRSYRLELLSLADTGIQVHDMTAISEYLYSRKKPKDFLPNPLHPGDYLARWYGLGLAEVLTEDKE